MSCYEKVLTSLLCPLLGLLTCSFVPNLLTELFFFFFFAHRIKLDLGVVKKARVLDEVKIIFLL